LGSPIVNLAPFYKAAVHTYINTHINTHIHTNIYIHTHIFFVLGC